MGTMVALLFDRVMNHIHTEALPAGQLQHPGVIIKDGKAYVFQREQGIQEMVYLEATTMYLDKPEAVEAKAPKLSIPKAPESVLPKQKAPASTSSTAGTTSQGSSESSPTAAELKAEKLEDEAHDPQAE